MLDFTQLYPYPETYKDHEGRSLFAYVTFVMKNDSYIPGALVLAYCLRKQHTCADLVCLVTKEITGAGQQSLEALFDKVILIDEIFVPHDRRQERQDRPYLFTRFQSLRTGLDGDLGVHYEKIVLVDADVLPLRCYDHLFTQETPSGIINERKSFCMEYDDRGQYIIPSSVAEAGKWNWHALYDPICPHGARIPSEITNRIKLDPANLGINSALWILQPSMKEFEGILSDLDRPEIHNLISRIFNWPEMQYATLHWSGLWNSVDLRFCSFNGYPRLAVLCGTHFAGYKPWNFKNVGTITRFSRFPDYSLWQHTYKEMMDSYPSLFEIPRLRRLRSQVVEMIEDLT